LENGNKQRQTKAIQKAYKKARDKQDDYFIPQILVEKREIPEILLYKFIQTWVLKS